LTFLPLSRSILTFMKHGARILIGFIALFAMVWVHAFKPVRGFECNCGGKSVFTVAEHCHDHEDEEPSHHHEPPAGGDTHHHTAVIESLTALKSDSLPFEGSATTPPLIFMKAAPLVLIRGRNFTPRRIPMHPAGRRWPQILSRSIALLV
jgi:hypothetical protein